jgi:MFS family permease
MASSNEPAGPALSDHAPSAAPRAIGGALFIALLIFTQLPCVLAFTIPLPLLAGMAQELAHDSTGQYLAKMVLGVLGPSMAIGAPLGGWLADKFDRRWLLMGIGALYVLSGIAPAFLESLEIIVLARFFTGLAAAALLAIGLTMVGDYLPEEKRAGTIGMLSALNMVASLLTLPAAGFVGDDGWRLPFLLYLLAVPVILLASPRALPVPAKPAAATAAEERRRRWYAGVPAWLVLLALAVGIILTIPGIYVSFHLSTVGLGKTSTVGLLMMLNSLIAAVFSAVFGKAWRYSPRMVFCFGFSTMALGLILFASATGYLVAIPALLLMGAGMGWLAPCVQAKVVDTVDERHRGKVVGAIQGVLSIAPLLGLTALEPLMPVIGTKGIMIVVGALSTIFFLGFAFRRSGRLAAA